MKKLYRVTLTEKKREELQALASKGTAAARKLVRVRTKLKRLYSAKQG